MAGSSGLRAAEAEYRMGVLAEPRRKMPWPPYAAAVLFFVIDRLLKSYALRFGENGATGPVAFTLFRNTGIAFSIPVPENVFWPVAVAVFSLLVFAFANAARKSAVAAAPVFVILLGAASNLADRVLYGATIDYLLFFGRSAVNLADGMIVGGVLYLLLKERRASKKIT
jgi:lipoprotein signal peptidase